MKPWVLFLGIMSTITVLGGLLSISELMLPTEAASKSSAAAPVVSLPIVNTEPKIDTEPRIATEPKTDPKTERGGIQLGELGSLGGVRPFPDDDDWNTPIAHLPVDPKSGALVAAVGADAPLHPDFGPPRAGFHPGIPYVVVSGDQPRWPVKFDYADESDHELYPIPANPPIEGGANSQGDRHIIMLDRDHGRLYELFAARQQNGLWLAGSGAVFDLRSHPARPLGWTSADAAGLPIFPGLVRYDEVEQGEIRHALRYTVKTTRRAYVHPARHHASRSQDPALPPMGMRVRLRASYDISKLPRQAQVVARALQRYGMILSDNGGNWFVTGTPDARWDSSQLATLKLIKGRDLEVVHMANIRAN